jgi:hypothetical protein
MKNKYLKSGTAIKVYLDGGWEIEGIVIEDIEDRIILEESNDPVLLFKNKINAIRILVQRELVASETTPQETAPEVVPPFLVLRTKKKEESYPPEDGIEDGSYLEGVMSIPMTVINSDPEKVNPFNDDDFSVSMKSIGQSSGDRRINVSLVREDE